MDKVVVTCTNAAIMLAVPTQQVYKLAKDGKLQTTGKGRGVRVLVSSIEAYKNAPVVPHVPKPLIIKPENKTKGFVYLVRLGLYHKIGITKNVRSRLSSMQVGHPDQIELVHTIPTNDMLRAETLLHEQFASQRVRAEWFSLTPADVALIQSHEFMNF